MNISSLGGLLPSAGLGEAAGMSSQGALRGGGGGLGGLLAPGNLTGELTSGLSDDASNMNMLSQLASTLGNLASNCTASASNAGLATAGGGSSGVTVPTPASSGQQFRSYSSLEQAQQGGSSSDATLASIIDGASDDGGNA